MALQKVPDSFISSVNEMVYAHRITTDITVPTIVTQADTTIIYNSATTNLNSAYNVSTGVWTAPFTGIYRLAASIQYDVIVTANTGSRLAWFLKNGATVIGRVGTAAEQDPYVSSNISRLVQLTAGDTIVVKGAQNSGNNYKVRYLPGYTYFTVHLIQLTPTFGTTSENMITNDSSYCVFRAIKPNSQNFISATPAIVTFTGGEVFDNQNAFNPTTGRFTAPITGKYFFNSGVGASRSGSNGSRFIWLQKNVLGSNETVAVEADNHFGNGSNQGMRVSATLDLTANDTIDVYYFQSTGSTESSTTASSGAYCYFEGYLVEKAK